MSETPTKDWSHEEINSWAEEQGIDLPDGTKDEKLDAIEAARSDSDDMPEPQATPPAPDPDAPPEEEGDEDEPIPGTVESHDTEEDGVLRRADGTVRPKVVKPAVSDDTGFKTGLGRTSAQFAKRARG